MFEELSHLFLNANPKSTRADYTSAIIEENCLGKQTSATRRLTNQRLGELYGLDLSIPIFRVFRSLWNLDQDGQRLLTLLCAVARDPLLSATTSSILSLPSGAEFLRDQMKTALRRTTRDRLNEGVLNKVIRNAASSWTQSGHLDGRTFKKRRSVRPTPANVAFALYLAYATGFRGMNLFNSGWIALLDCYPSAGRDLALEAKRQGFIDLNIAGDVLDINFNRLDSNTRRQ